MVDYSIFQQAAQNQALEWKLKIQSQKKFQVKNYFIPALPVQ